MEDIDRVCIRPEDLQWHMVLGSSNRTLVTISPDGEVTLGEGVSVDEAARAFWDAVAGIGSKLRERAEAAERDRDALAEAAAVARKLIASAIENDRCGGKAICGADITLALALGDPDVVSSAPDSAPPTSR